MKDTPPIPHFGNSVQCVIEQEHAERAEYERLRAKYQTAEVKR
jgi:hypothetical protein